MEAGMHDEQVQLNYVLPEDLDKLLQRYCEQTGLQASTVLRRLISDWIGGEVAVEGAPEHPKGRRTSAYLPVRLLAAFEDKIENESKGTKSGVIAALLQEYLESRTQMGDTVAVVVRLPVALYEQLSQEGLPAEGLVRWAQIIASQKQP